MSDKVSKPKNLTPRKTVLYISIVTAAMVLLLFLVKELTMQREILPLQTPLPTTPVENTTP